MRKMSLHLVHRGLIVEIGKARKRVRRNQPDAIVPIRNTDESEIRLDISSGQGADSLAVQRHAFLGRSLGLVADAPQVAGESAIDHDLQLRSKIFALSLTPA